MNSKILAIFLSLMIVIIAGCSGEDTEPLNVTPESNTTQTTNESTAEPVTTPSTQPSKYEASGYCYHVVDGDTIDVEGVGRIRFVGVNTPERGEPGYQEAKDYVKNMCLGKIVYLDIDDEKHYDKYGRVLAVVYVDSVNLNAELLKRGYAEVMYIPPSEFDPYSWT